MPPDERGGYDHLTYKAGFWVGPGGAPFSQEDADAALAKCLYAQNHDACEVSAAFWGQQRAAGAAYCQANQAACDLQGQQTALTVLVAIEVALTAVTLVDFVPGDEIAAGGATAATFSRLSAIPQEIAALEAAALRGETTIQRSPAQSRVELGRNLVEAAGPGFVRRAEYEAHHTSSN